MLCCALYLMHYCIIFNALLTLFKLATLVGVLHTAFVHEEIEDILDSVGYLVHGIVDILDHLVHVLKLFGEDVDAVVGLLEGFFFFRLLGLGFRLIRLLPLTRSHGELVRHAPRPFTAPQFLDVRHAFELFPEFGPCL